MARAPVALAFSLASLPDYYLARYLLPLGIL